MKTGQRFVRFDPAVWSPTCQQEFPNAKCINKKGQRIKQEQFAKAMEEQITNKLAPNKDDGQANTKQASVLKKEKCTAICS